MLRKGWSVQDAITRGRSDFYLMSKERDTFVDFRIEEEERQDNGLPPVVRNRWTSGPNGGEAIQAMFRALTEL